MKHLNLEFERLEQRIAPGVGGSASGGSKSGASASGSKSGASASGSKSGGSGS